MVDDSYYITPHETALAVVATAMKKARLRFDTLVINSLMGGVLFCAGGLLFVMARSENPAIFEQNPGLTNFLGAFTFSIGLFYVVINGADLFNSNVLFFTVGLLRGAVSIYDLVISWVVSLLGNLAGTLFVCYVICHLSGATTSDMVVTGSRSIAEQKASPSFIQTFLKAIAGNFYVCVAVYLQLMCKPLHVKYIVMTLPIFTFVALGFTNVVADMSMLIIGMLNGANVSVAKCIWKVLIPGALGNIVGGCFFSGVVPYYLHLCVVERDRKQLSLPEFEARDEQPELNMDSRVVRVDPREVEEAEEDSDVDTDDERYGLLEKQSSGTSDTNTSDQVLPYTGTPRDSRELNRINTANTMTSGRSHSSRVRNPPGVFPVRGMGKPLKRERTIVDSEYSDEGKQSPKRAPSVTNSFDIISTHSDMDSNFDNPLGISSLPPQERRNSILRTLSRIPTAHHPPLTHHKTHEDSEEEREVEEYEREGHYNVLDHKLGTKLERALSRIATHKSDDNQLPRTTQDVFPEQRHVDTLNPMTSRRSSTSVSGIFKTISRQLAPSKQPTDVEEIHRRLSQAGVTTKAAQASDNIAGIDNYDGIELPPSHSPFYKRRPSSTSNFSSNSLNTAGSVNKSKKTSPAVTPGPPSTASMSGGGALSVAGKRPQNPMKNIIHYDNDNFEEQSVMDMDMK